MNKFFVAVAITLVVVVLGAFSSPLISKKPTVALSGTPNSGMRTVWLNDEVGRNFQLLKERTETEYKNCQTQYASDAKKAALFCKQTQLEWRPNPFLLGDGVNAFELGIREDGVVLWRKKELVNQK